MTVETEIIQSLFSKEVEAVISNEIGLIASLYPEERELIKHAIQKRQGEFAAGRLCAKEGLKRLGIENFPILKDKKGAPIWQEGVRGSISHAQGCCAAVVARVRANESLGLDIEKIDRLGEDLWEYLFVEEELKWLKSQNSNSQKSATLLFAAKEAFYKAQYLLSHAWVGFKDVFIEINETKNEFTVHLMVKVERWPQDTKFVGKYVFFNQYVACGIWIEEI